MPDGMSVFFNLVDGVLIAPYRWIGDPLCGFWLGTAILAFLCLVVGELTYALVFLGQSKRFFAMQDKARHYHNLSVDAIHAGNKDAYLAANTLAQEEFGQGFFAQAALGLSSIWPLPFALGWLAMRFEGITLHVLPLLDLPVNYVCVFVVVYVTLRLSLGRWRRHIPLLSRVERLKREAQESHPAAKRF